MIIITTAVHSIALGFALPLASFTPLVSTNKLLPFEKKNVGIQQNERADQLAEQGTAVSTKTGPNVNVATGFASHHFAPAVYDG